MEEKKIACCVFLDFAKAFDTVNHEILLTKVRHYGIRGVCLDWFRSYLSNRPQCVKIGEHMSESFLYPVWCTPRKRPWTNLVLTIYK